MSQSPTTFYSASAGSGKTYTLARDYLTLLFQSQFHNHYRKILAVTFTNKAVAEMKERILEHLHNFTKNPIPDKSTGIFEHIIRETGLNQEQAVAKAVKIHNRLLHDYSAFDIVTIDAFNHRILRTFAKDIDLPAGFEVELDTDSLIHKAIQNLLARAGEDQELTQTLVNFSLSKIDADKSWDIAYDLLQISALIRNENHFKYLQTLEDKTPADFKNLKSALEKSNQEIEQNLGSIAKELIEKIASQGISSTDFKGGASRSIFNAVIKVSKNDYSVKPDAASIRDLIAGDLYAKKQQQEIKGQIDNLRDDLATFGNAYRESYGYLKFHANIIKSIIPLSLLKELIHEINLIKKEEQIVPIYEFNGLLAQQIKDQPAPFIYERLGEKYRHYFIDEFQDTSRMQWNNIAPLIGNAVQSEDEYGNQGTLMLVGDAKQSIYRWRGGDADQFLGLLGDTTIFELDKKEETLPFNWRSYDEVIMFNNSFFEFYGDYLEAPAYQELYHKYLAQETVDKEGGYIQIDFLDKEDTTIDEDDDVITPYPQHVLALIKKITSQNYNLGDICILVRKHTQGHEVAQFLVKNDIKVVSGDSLLVSASSKVLLLIELIKCIHQPEQQVLKLQFLLQYASFHNIEGIHHFVLQHLELSLDLLILELLGEEHAGLESAFAKVSLFKAIELTANALELFKKQDVRLQSFMELVFEFSNGYDVSLSKFLEHWENKKEKLSVPATPDPDAVQIMTIHKSKGLEFPVVIVPYCDTKLNHSMNPTDWVTVNPESYAGFEHLYLSLKSEAVHYPETAATVYQSHLHKTQMDHVNELYVAFTRAVEQLYICGLNTPESKNQKDSSLTYSQLLKRYVDLKMIPATGFNEQDSYQMGTATKNLEHTLINPTEELGAYQTSSSHSRARFSTRRGEQWESGAQEAIIKGNVLHDYMAQIITVDDLPAVLKKIESDLNMTEQNRKELSKTLQKIVSKAYFIKYFDTKNEVINERGILTPQGKMFIPDRLIINDQKVTILDYKTGAKIESHRDQLDYYAALLQEMGYEIDKKVLLYTDQLEELVWN